MDPTQTKEYIIKNLNLGSLPPSEQDSIIQKLESNIEKKALIAILDALDKDEKEKLLALSKNGNAAAVNNFIEERLPNAKEIIEAVSKEVVDDFRQKS